MIYCEGRKSWRAEAEYHIGLETAYKAVATQNYDRVFPIRLPRSAYDQFVLIAYWNLDQNDDIHLDGPRHTRGKSGIGTIRIFQIRLFHSLFDVTFILFRLIEILDISHYCSRKINFR